MKIGTLFLVFSLLTIPGQARPDLTRFTLTFEDEFEGTRLDPNRWEATDGELRQKKASRWKNNQVEVSNGTLKLKITKVSTDPEPTVRYHCGSVRTRKGYSDTYLFRQKYGYYEARYKLPARIDMDYWAAFWLMAGPVSQTTDTRVGMEIDIMESFTYARGYHSANFHWGGYGAKHNKYSLICGPQNQVLDGQFHTFALSWDPEAYIIYIDGAEVGRTDMKGLGSIPGLPPSNGTTQSEAWLLLSCEAALFPGKNSRDWEPNAPDQDVFEVDYVRIYELKPAFTSDLVSPGPDSKAARLPRGASITGR